MLFLFLLLSATTFLLLPLLPLTYFLEVGLDFAVFVLEATTGQLISKLHLSFIRQTMIVVKWEVQLHDYC